MLPDRTKVYELHQQAAKLTPDEQMELVALVLRDIRMKHFFDPEPYQRALREELADLIAREAAQRGSDAAAVPM